MKPLIITILSVLTLASCATEQNLPQTDFEARTIDYVRVVGMKNGEPNGTSRIIAIPRNKPNN